jgi:Xaa-Pro dipeptidase
LRTIAAMSGAHVFTDSRKATYLNIAAADHPLRSPIAEQTHAAARRYRLGRVREQLELHDCAAILLHDPLNVRYAMDVSNMQVWMAHNPTNYAVICAGGPAVHFAYAGSEHLAAGLETVDEARTAIAWQYMDTPGRVAETARAWATEVGALVAEHGGRNRRLAIDVCDPAGIAALDAVGLEIVEGRELTEQARVIKSADELELMRWTLAVCDAAIQRMYERSAEAGRSELEIWAELHHENIRNGGEWIETRLLTSGPRTNPWFQEASGRIPEAGDMLAFDTDMIGPYGYCADISRSWTVGHTPPSPHQRDLYRHAREQIEHNTSLLRAGLGLREFNERAWRIPERFLGNEYGWAFHGVGMADEYPGAPTHPSFAGSAYDREDLCLATDMVLAMESLVGEPGRGECVKLETQVVVTTDGCERLDAFPWEDW